MSKPSLMLDRSVVSSFLIEAPPLMIRPQRIRYLTSYFGPLGTSRGMTRNVRLQQAAEKYRESLQKAQDERMKY
jgi:hypothetical protein